MKIMLGMGWSNVISTMSIGTYNILIVKTQELDQGDTIWLTTIVLANIFDIDMKFDAPIGQVGLERRMSLIC